MRGHHLPDLANSTGGNKLPETDHVRQEPRPHGLQGHKPLGLCQVNDVLCLAGVHRERFLHQHVLARVQRQQRVGVMEGWGGVAM